MSGRRFWIALGGNWVGELFIRAPQLAVDLLVIRMLSASQLGVWVGFRAAFQFTSALSGVPLAGLDLEYSYAMGRDHRQAARESAGAAMYAVILLTLLTAALISPGLWFADLRHGIVQGAKGMDFAIFLALIVAQGFYNFYITHLRNQLKFLQVNAVALVGNLLTVGLALWLTPLWGVWGVLTAFGVGYSVCPLIWFRWTDTASSPRAHRVALIRQLCATGATLAAVAVAVSGLRLVARWFIGQQFGESAVGQYGVAATAAGAVLLAGGATSRVVMQFAARAAGAQMDYARQSVQFALLPGIAIAGAGAFACIAVASLADWILPIWAPQHVAAVEVLRPVLYASLAFGVASVLASALRAQSRQRALLVATVAVIGLHLALLLVGASMRWPLRGFAAAEIVSFFAFLFAMLALLKCRRDQRLAFGICVLLAAGFCALGIELSRQLAPGEHLVAALLRCAYACLLFSPWLAISYLCVRIIQRPPRPAVELVDASEAGRRAA